MNPLAHAYFALELFKSRRLTPDQKDHLIVGSIIPDISELGLLNFYRTHTQGLKFLQQAKDRLHYYFALGIISHGEDPPGLDFHSHKKNGYLQSKQKAITCILRKYQNHVGKLTNGLAHNITEFSVDYLVAQKDPAIIKKVRLAFLNPRVITTLNDFLSFLNIPQRKIKKITRYLNHRHLHNFFSNSQTLSGMANNWLNLRFYHHLKQGKYLPFTEKLKRWTKFSYYNFKRKLHNQHIASLFRETSAYLEKDCYSFLSQNQKELTQLQNELLKNPSSQKG